MDKSAEKHAKKWGCWFNRDIDSIIEASGLQVVQNQRNYFGTLYLVVAKPNKANHQPQNVSAS